MIRIKTRLKLNKLKDKLTKTWYFIMKPLASVLIYLSDNNYKKLKTKTWNEKKIKRQINKQIQKLALHHHQSKYEKCFYLIDRYIYDVQREFGGMYNASYLFKSHWSLLKNEYLDKYSSYGFKGNEQEFIDKWIPVIIDICKDNELNIIEVNKDDLCPDNKYWKYDDVYKKLNRVWKVVM